MPRSILARTAPSCFSSASTFAWVLRVRPSDSTIHHQHAVQSLTPTAAACGLAAQDHCRASLAGFAPWVCKRDSTD